MPPQGASKPLGAEAHTSLRVSAEIASEAAVWVARLHGPDRSLAMERECLAWQTRSAMHRLAFERCTDTWQHVAGLHLTAYAAAIPDAQRGSAARLGVRRSLLASAALGCAALIALRMWPGDQVYETAVGEQRVVLLADGTRMTLNTSTDVRVDVTKTRRTVKLRRGEALFDVAKDPGRPFVVQVRDAEVVATGTSFLVQDMPAGVARDAALSVTLLEGQVVVRDAAGSPSQVPAHPVVMKPGERLRMARPGTAGSSPASAPPQLDRPHMDQVLAWRRGEAVFEDASLREAVDEINRYGSVPITVIDGTAMTTARVSGSFRTGDSAGFARAVAKLHGLTVRERPGRLELAAP